MKDPQTLKKLNEYVGGLKGKKIVYVPTAGNAEGWESWKSSESLRVIQNLGANVKIVVLEEYWNKDVTPELKEQDIIWFGGGQPGYLLYWIRRSQLNIKRILDKGVLYVGSSAGAMIAGVTNKVTGWYVGENEYGADTIPSLNLVDFDIYPHFRDELLPEIKKLNTSKKLYLLKDGEEIIVEDDKITVVGEERVITQ